MSPILRALFASTLLLTVSATLAGCQKASDAAFGQKVRAYLLEHPEVLQEAAQKYQEKQQAEAAKASTAAIGKYRAQLERDPRDLVINPDGRVTVVEFFDYRCSYCKLAAPEVVRLVQQNRDVRLVLKQFPIFGEVSDTAAQVALTPQGKAKGFELYQTLLAQNALDEASLDRHLAEVGIDPAQAHQQAKDPAIARQLIETRQLASNLHIEGTPAFIVGDTMIPGADLDALRAAINQQRGKGLS